MNLETIHQQFLDDPEYRAAYVQEDLIHRVAARVAKLRAAKGLSQADLAEMVGTKQPAIAALEGGYRNLRLSSVAKLAYALGCDAECLTSKEEPPDLIADDADEGWSQRRGQVQGKPLIEAFAYEPMMEAA